MAGIKSLRKSMKDLRVKMADVAARTAASGEGASIQVAHRENLETAINIGQTGAVQQASTIQDAPIVQTGRRRENS